MRPILSRVAAEQTGESVTLAAARRFTLAYIDQVDPPGAPSPELDGRPLPLHATSSGKVFLAWLPEDERDGGAAAAAGAATPSATITDRDRLDAVLAEIRRLGYSTCVGELEEYSNGVSAAVLERLKAAGGDRQHLGPQPAGDPARRLPVLGRVALQHRPRDRAGTGMRGRLGG